jgi:transketolase
MMEGVASEAASLAGHLKLANLCWIYDNNHITIDGPTDIAFDEDVGRRFEAYGWKVLRVHDANDIEAFARALETFRQTDDGRPSSSSTATSAMARPINRIRARRTASRSAKRRSNW